MTIFRRAFDARHAIARPITAQDTRALTALGRRAPWCYLTGPLNEVVELAWREPTAVLEHDQHLVAAVQVGWRLPPNAWLRTILVDSRVDVTVALHILLPQVHRLLPAYKVDSVFITIDAWNEPWLQSPLQTAGYERVMEVWSYDKRGMNVPAAGNPELLVRPARSGDLQAILRVDTACFPAPWGKGEEVMRPALSSALYFAVGEWKDEVIGYVHLSLHGSGRQAHLVRIAVLPTFQGSGFGVRLLAEAVRFCRQQHVDVLTLNTQDHNRQAQRLYEWFGFRRTLNSQTVLGIRQLPR